MDHTTNLAILTLGAGGVLAVTIGYALGGLVCLIVAISGFGGSGKGARVLSGIIGVACLGYAAYIVLGDSETIWISFKIMLLPVLVLIQAIVGAVRKHKNGGQQQGNQGANSPAPGYGAPQYGAAQQPGQPYGAPQQPGPQNPAQPYGQPNQYGQPAPAPAQAQAQAGSYGQPAPQGQYGTPGQYGQPSAAPTSGMPQPANAPTSASPQQTPRQSPPPPPPAQRDQPLWPQQDAPAAGGGMPPFTADQAPKS